MRDGSLIPPGIGVDTGTVGVFVCGVETSPLLEVEGIEEDEASIDGGGVGVDGVGCPLLSAPEFDNEEEEFKRRRAACAAASLALGTVSGCVSVRSGEVTVVSGAAGGLSGALSDGVVGVG